MEWRSVDLETWNDLYMVVRSVLAELPPGTQLLLRQADDERAAHITARPQPRFEVHAGGRRLAVLPSSTESDLIEHLRANLEDHWEVDHPSQLEHGFSEQVSTRLASAFADDEIVRDLPEAERPRPSSHTSGERGRDDVMSRLDPEVAEKLRQLGSSALD